MLRTPPPPQIRQPIPVSPISPLEGPAALRDAVPSQGKEGAGGGGDEGDGADVEGQIIPAEVEAGASLDRPLTDREGERLMKPLLRLRQACCHPQIGSSGASRDPCESVID